jgi:NADH dehydrogenase
MGVLLKLSKSVKEFNGEQLVLDDGDLLHVKTVIWTAGVMGTLPAGIKPDSIARGNRIKVDRSNRVLNYSNIYAIGDIAYMETPAYNHGHPQLASVANSQAKHLARNIRRLLKGQTTIPYEFVDHGVMATIGKRKAVVDLAKPKFHLNGRFAWFIWMFLHLFLILGIKNKLQVFINWVYKYFTSDQSLRLAQRIKGHTEELEGIKSYKDFSPLIRPVYDGSGRQQSSLAKIGQSWRVGRKGGANHV